MDSNKFCAYIYQDSLLLLEQLFSSLCKVQIYDNIMLIPKFYNQEFSKPILNLYYIINLNTGAFYKNNFSILWL